MMQNLNKKSTHGQMTNHIYNVNEIKQMEQITMTDGVRFIYSF